MIPASIPNEKRAPYKNGMFMLLVVIIGLISSIACIILGAIRMDAAAYAIGGILLAVGCVGVTAFCISFAGFKVLAPNQAYVFTLFGKYYGTLRESGFYFVSPFVSANAPAMMNGEPTEATTKAAGTQVSISAGKPKKISLKTRTLDNRTQKVNDAMGNPIIIGSVVIWRVDDPTAAVFSVENFEEYLSIQCDSTIRNIARLYPYDTMEDDVDERTLRGSSSEISEIMQQELAERVKDAGLIIEDVRITTLAYAVEGAVGMVKMAIDQLNEEEVVVLDEERKAQMVSNLLVVLCGNKDAQPIVNSGSIY